MLHLLLYHRAEDAERVGYADDNKKNHAAGMAISYLPPEIALAGAARRQRKSRPSGRPNLGKFHFGGCVRHSSNPF